MSRCDVFLENYNNYYCAGQPVIGYLQCTFTNEKTVYGIKLNFKGEAKTEWTETESHYNSTTKKHESRSVHYSGHETYFTQELNLLHNAGDGVTLAEGVHNYPFNFILPANLPSSFGGTYGDVKYSVQGVVQRSFLKFNYEAEACFNVVTILDLNHHVELKESQHFKKEKGLCCFCLKSGPINFELNVPYTGYAVGQAAPLYLYIENMANASVEKVTFSIIQTIEFKTTSPRHHSRYINDTIVEKQCTGVGAHGDRTYEETLAIPASFSAPNLERCSLIEITYKLKVVAYLPCPHKNITAKIPVVIGHIPLMGTNLSQPQAAPTYGFVDAPPAYNPSASIIPSAPSAGMIASAPSAASPPVESEELIDWEMLGEASAPDSNPTAPPPTYDQAIMNQKT